ncbi:MAG: amidohydrolase family protein [Bacteroidota bacterium]
MVSHISASYVYTIAGPPIQNGVVGLDAEGTIIEVLTPAEAEELGIADVKHYDGLIVPGFVNTHCHLELSNLKGAIAKHTGLPAFVQQVMDLRAGEEFTDEYMLDSAMLRADKEMFECGIVAVGDIANQSASRMTKRGSLIHYHTFVEAIGFNPETVQLALQRAVALKKEFEPLPASIVPHAPYSVSAGLFEELKKIAEEENSIVSIHNQETPHENAFFEEKEGEFLELYYMLALDIEFFQPSGKTSLQTYLSMLSGLQPTLLVHNTFTSAEDVAYAIGLHKNLYWCLCPNANLYIENTLPNVPMLRDAGASITLGTDSLASNDRLSIFAEMMTLQDRFDISADELLKWATWNGAEFMGLGNRLGTLQPGKRPGINLLGFSELNGKIKLEEFSRRLY